MNLLDKFCADNDFIVVTDEMLKDNNMYKDIVYASNNNFVGKAVYPKEMPIIMNNGVWIKLININKPLLIIPSLAIHMNREVNNGYKYNAQVDTLPLLG